MDEFFGYALVVACKQVIGGSGSVLVKEGSEMLVMNEPEGWVEATSTHWREEMGVLPQDTKIFASIEEANAFATRWGGHPWYCQPNNSFRVLRVQQVHVQKPAGFVVTKGD